MWPGTEGLHGLELVTTQAPLQASGVSETRWLMLVSRAGVCGALVLPYTALGCEHGEQAGHRPQTSQRGVCAHTLMHTHICSHSHVRMHSPTQLHSCTCTHNALYTLIVTYTHSRAHSHTLTLIHVTHSHIHALTSPHTRLAVVCGEAHFSLCSAQHCGPLESSTATL